VECVRKGGGLACICFYIFVYIKSEGGRERSDRIGFGTYFLLLAFWSWGMAAWVIIFGRSGKERGVSGSGWEQVGDEHHQASVYITSTWTSHQITSLHPRPAVLFYITETGSTYACFRCGYILTVPLQGGRAYPPIPRSLDLQLPRSQRVPSPFPLSVPIPALLSTQRNAAPRSQENLIFPKTGLKPLPEFAEHRSLTDKRHQKKCFSYAGAGKGFRIPWPERPIPCAVPAHTSGFGTGGGWVAGVPG